MAAQAPEYELVLMLDPEAPDERREAIAADARKRIESNGSITHDTTWGMRKLAFEIEQRTEADYRFFRFESGGTPLLDELNHNLRIAEGVLRFRIFKVDPDSPVVTPPPPTPLSSGKPERGERGDRGRRDGSGRGRDGSSRGRGGADDEPVAAPVEPVEAQPARAASAPAVAAPAEAAPAPDAAPEPPPVDAAPASEPPASEPEAAAASPAEAEAPAPEAPADDVAAAEPESAPADDEQS